METTLEITEYSYCTSKDRDGYLLRCDLLPLKSPHVYSLVCAICNKRALPHDVETIHNENRGANGQALGFIHKSSQFDENGFELKDITYAEFYTTTWIKHKRKYYLLHNECLEVYKCTPNMELITK